jgi:hypothetical protein
MRMFERRSQSKQAADQAIDFISMLGLAGAMALPRPGDKHVIIAQDQPDPRGDWVAQRRWPYRAGRVSGLWNPEQRRIATDTPIRHKCEHP